MNRIEERVGFYPMQLTSKGMSILSTYNWPGNIRELENVLERFMNESTSTVIPDLLVMKQMQTLPGSSSQNKIVLCHPWLLLHFCL
uniref:hypothetical protein n=1 Tax=Siminovitchia sp. FSL W7-1587 TaxID=2954699 RepID=UPI00403E87E6